MQNKGWDKIKVVLNCEITTNPLKKLEAIIGRVLN